MGYRDGVLKDKSMEFAIRIVKLYKYLAKEKHEIVMAKQLLRAGTAIGAVQREGEYAEGKADFVHKYAISQKECSEVIYWLELLYQSGYLTPAQHCSMNKDAEELMKLLTASIKTAKSSLITNH